MNYALGWITALLVVCLQEMVTGQSDSDEVVSVTPPPNEVAMNVELQTSNEYLRMVGHSLKYEWRRQHERYHQHESDSINPFGKKEQITIFRPRTLGVRLPRAGVRESVSCVGGADRTHETPCTGCSVRPGSSYCYIGYNAIPHGSLGSVSTLNPCWKKLCWYGQLYDREDGCYFQGQCYGINSEFEVDCVTRSCRKTARSDNSYRYSIEYVRQGCQDAQRRCRRVGETNFSAYVRGYYFSNCVCRSEGYTICHGSG